MLHLVLQHPRNSKRVTVIQFPLVCHPRKPFGMLRVCCTWMTGLQSHYWEPGRLAGLWWSHECLRLGLGLGLGPGLGRQSSAACPSQVRSCCHQGAACWLWLTLQKLFVLSGTSFGGISRNQRLRRGQGCAVSQGRLGLFSQTPQARGAQRRGVITQEGWLSGTAGNSKSSLMEIPPLNQSKTTLRNIFLFQFWNH